MPCKKLRSGKRVLSFLLAFLILAALLPEVTLPALAATQNYKGDNIAGEGGYDYSIYTFTYTDEGELQGCLDDEGNGPKGKFEIPSAINGTAITSIAASTRDKRGFGTTLEAIDPNANAELTELIIPGSIKTIGTAAFQNCTGLTSIVFNEGLETLGDQAFMNAYGLTSITLPRSMVVFGDNVFYVYSSGSSGNTASKIKDIILPRNVRNTTASTFYGMRALEHITILGAITNLAGGLINHQSNIKTLILPDTISVDFVNNTSGIIRAVPAQSLELLIAPGEYKKANGTDVNTRYFVPDVQKGNFTPIAYCNSGTPMDTYLKSTGATIRYLAEDIEFTASNSGGSAYSNDSLTPRHNRGWYYGFERDESLDPWDITALDALLTAHDALYNDFELGKQLVIDGAGNITKAFDTEGDWSFTLNGNSLSGKQAVITVIETEDELAFSCEGAAAIDTTLNSLTSGGTYDISKNLEGFSFKAGTMTTSADTTKAAAFSESVKAYNLYINENTSSVNFSLGAKARGSAANLRLTTSHGGYSDMVTADGTWDVTIPVVADSTELSFTVSHTEGGTASVYTVNIIRVPLSFSDITIWNIEPVYSASKESNTAMYPSFDRENIEPTKNPATDAGLAYRLLVYKGTQKTANVELVVKAGTTVNFDNDSKSSGTHTISDPVTTSVSGRSYDKYTMTYAIADNTGALSALNASLPKLKIDSRTIKFELYYRTNYTDVFTPDKVFEYAPAKGAYVDGSDYVGYRRFGGAVPLHGVTTFADMATLGNFGGYASYRYEDPIVNDPNNPYGVDFIIYGNAFEGGKCNEPASVEVSQDGIKWYYLAGQRHYDLTTLFGRSATLLDGREVQTMALEGLNGYPEKVSFGYADVMDCGPLGQNAQTLYHVEGRPQNPYSRQYGNVGDMMDISWAVDSNGKPVHLESIKYIRVQNIADASLAATGGITPEICAIVRTDKFKEAGAVGVAAAPKTLKVAGVNILQETAKTITKSGGANITEYYEIDVSQAPLAAVAVDVEGESTTNIYVNDTRYTGSGKYTTLFDGSGNRTVRVIMQNGNLEPHIYVIKVTGGDAEAAKKNTDLEYVVMFPGDAELQKTGGDYTATVPNAVNSISFMTGAFNPNAQKVELTAGNGTTNASWTTMLRDERNEKTYPLVNGENIFTVKVTSEDGEATATHKVVIVRNAVAEGVTVKFSLTGKSAATAGDNQQVWIPEFEVSGIPVGASVKYVTDMVLQNQGFETYLTSKGTYIAAITKPGIPPIRLEEKGTTEDSGWMYKYNDIIGNYGYAEQIVRNGATIEWFYTDNYKEETTDWEAIDRSNLGLAIAEAKAIGNFYTPESWKVLQDAVSEAERVFADTDATQDEANTAEAAIDAAIAGLTVPGPVSKTELSTLISTADTKEESAYTPATWTPFASALSTAKTIAAKTDATQTEVDDAKSALQTAMNALAVKSAPPANNYAEATAGVLQYVYDSNSTSSYPNPIFGSVGGEWVMVGLARGGFLNSSHSAWVEKYLDALINQITTGSRVQNDNGKIVFNTNAYTDNDRVILALTALGYDASSWEGYDFVTPLKDVTNVLKQTDNGAIWALIALDSHDYLPSETALRNTYIQNILSIQETAGSWKLGNVTDYDMTCMAIQALAPYYNRAEVKTAVDKALTWLSGQQNSTTGRIGTSSEAVSQAIVALTALDIDPTEDARFIKNGKNLLDALLDYRVSDTTWAFKHAITSGENYMATEQAAYALVAYERFVSRKNTLYDMTDVTFGQSAAADKTTLNAVIATADSKLQANYTMESWTPFAAALSTAKTVAAKTDATQTEVDNAASVLQTAMNGLATHAPVEVSKTALNAAISTAESKAEADYTAGTWAPFAAALSAAKTVTAKADATQAEVDNAEIALQTAMSNLTAPSAVNKTALNNLIATAENKVKAEHTDASWTPFAAALSAARTVSVNANATQAEVDSARTALQTAMDALKATGKPIKVRFSLFGALKHDGEPKYIYKSNPNIFEEWMVNKEYTFEAQTVTVYDVFVRAIAELGFEAEITSRNNYVSSIKGPKGWIGEFDNGNLSGWMYTLNGTHPDLGLSEQTLKDGDVVVWHYTDDYTQEEGGNNWGPAPGGDITATITVTPSISGGTATIRPTTGNITDALETVTEGLKGKPAGTIGEIIITGNTGSADTMIFNLFASDVKAVGDAGNVLLTVKGGAGTITLDSATLKGISTGAASRATISITVKKLSASDMSSAQNEIVGSSPAYELSITVDGIPVHNFSGTVTVILPYTGADGSSMKVYYLGADGKPVAVPGARYDSSSKGMMFRIDHFSLFFIAETIEAKEPMSFIDVKQSDWFYEAVKYAYDNELVNGVGNNMFAPGESLTRAMLVTLLYRYENEPAVTAGIKFTDVPAGQWYTNAIIWATENKIVEGYGNGFFGTNDNITREQVATMLMRYAAWKKLDTSKTKELTAYTDAAQISDWALAAMKWANAEGLITGRTTTTLSPKGETTRAEVAMLLMRFIEDFMK